MSRLSIADLNKLSGVSKDELIETYELFRSAHTVLYNKMNKLINKSNISIYKYKSLTNMTGIMQYKISHEFKYLYHECILLLDNLTLFAELVENYQSLLHTLKYTDKIGEISKLMSIIHIRRKDLINIENILYDCIREIDRKEYNNEE